MRVALRAGTARTVPDLAEVYGISRDGSSLLAQVATPKVFPLTGLRLSIVSWDGLEQQRIAGTEAAMASWSR